MPDASLNPVSSLAGNMGNLLDPTVFNQWLDTGVSGTSESIVSKGGIISSAQTAANWSSPGASTTYGANGQVPDYYIVLGWSLNEGTWATVSQVLAGNASWNVTGAGSWFGMSTIGLNYAGGGSGLPSPLPATGLWSGTTTLANQQGISAFELTPITVVPEPATLAIAGLGGLAMLLIRRRK